MFKADSDWLIENEAVTQFKFGDKGLDARAEIIIVMEPAQVNMIQHYWEAWTFLEDIYYRKTTRQKAKLFGKMMNYKMTGSNISPYLKDFNAIIMPSTYNVIKVISLSFTK